jgi:HrpA-like RNA helicase
MPVLSLSDVNRQRISDFLIANRLPTPKSVTSDITPIDGKRLNEESQTLSVTPRLDEESQTPVSMSLGLAEIAKKGLEPATTRLPVHLHREVLLAAIAGNDVTLIRGETGTPPTQLCPERSLRIIMSADSADYDARRFSR